MVLSASVEAHLIRCAGCRARLAELADPVALRPVWAGIRDAIGRPPIPVPLRLLRRLGLPERDTVVLGASRSLRGPWAAASLVILTFALIAAGSQTPTGTAGYLLVAPLVPVFGVVAAFATDDHFSELTVATPFSKTRIALLRTVAVTLTTAPYVAAVGSVLPGVGWLAVAWLGPAVGLTVLALIAMTWLSATVTGVALTIVWSAVVGFFYGERDVALVVHARAQLVYLALTLVAAAGLVLRVRAARSPGGYA
jgi:hypothetical protein